MEAKLSIRKDLWNKLISSLAERGGGVKESGAFLLGNSTEVIEFMLYDDLDENCLDKGYVHFTGRGYIKLWEHCLQSGYAVIADVHTHPFGNVRQSVIDKQNPMISQAGHLALIVPDFAQTLPADLSEIGLYEYLGDFNWKTHPLSDQIISIWS